MDHRQPHTGSFMDPFGGKKRVKNFIHDHRINSGACILNREAGIETGLQGASFERQSSARCLSARLTVRVPARFSME